jgi:hypothetical protein
VKNLFLFLFLISCASFKGNHNNNKSLDFNDNLTFEEFNKLLIEYVEISSYPNLNQ